jgi:hypothetical protein
MVLYKTVASYGEIWLGRLAIATTLQNWKTKHCTQLCIDQGRLAPIGGSPYGPKEHFAK